MRTRRTADLDAVRDADGELPDNIGHADWKDSIATVLDVIDGLLEPHGLEVVTYDTNADDYAFKIEKRMRASQ